MSFVEEAREALLLNEGLPVLVTGFRNAPRRVVVKKRLGAVGGTEIHDFKRTLLGEGCAYCGAPADVLDHIEPKVRGGGNRFDNLTPACNPCNHAKRDRSLLGFLLFRLHQPEIDRTQADLDDLRRRLFDVGRLT